MMMYHNWLKKIIFLTKCDISSFVSSSVENRVNKLDIDQLEKLDVDQLGLVPTDLSELINVLNNDVLN